jgi:hypothetical protein
MKFSIRTGNRHLLEFAIEKIIVATPVYKSMGVAPFNFERRLGANIMARKNSLIGVSADDNNVLTFTVGSAGSFTVDPSTLADDITRRAMLHGLVQKVSDAAAMPKADLTGDAEKDAATKFEAMKSVAERLAAGEWSKRSGDGSGPVAGLIFRAFEEWVSDIAAKKKVAAPSAEKVRATYDAKTRAEQLALRNVPAIAKIIDRIKSERGAAATVDTGSLLGELGL